MTAGLNKPKTAVDYSKGIPQLCGAHIWALWQRLPLTGAQLSLFRYAGIDEQYGYVSYKFEAYGAPGCTMSLSYKGLRDLAHSFRPFLIDSAEFMEET